MQTQMFASDSDSDCVSVAAFSALFRVLLVRIQEYLPHELLNEWVDASTSRVKSSSWIHRERSKDDGQ